MPSSDQAKKPFDFHDYVDLGKRLASVAIVVIAFLHSLYASYIKEEDVAKETYSVQKEALEGFSNEVDVELAYLRGQVDILRAALAMPQRPARSLPEPAAPALPKRRVVESSEVADDDEPLKEDIQPPRPTRKREKRQPEARDMQQRSYKVNLPEAPWEKRTKK